MRINEILSESTVTEAISVSHFEGPLTAKINEAIREAIGDLTEIKDKFPEESAKYDDPESDTGGSAFEGAIRRELFARLQTKLSAKIMTTLNKLLGKKRVKKIKFEELPEGTKGVAQAATIALSRLYINSIVKRATTQLFSIVDNSYDYGERINGFYFMCRMIGSGDRVGRDIDEAVSKIMPGFVSTILHETVHVVQYDEQQSRGRGDIEYRSYLDKHKNEFRNRVNDAQASGDSATNSGDSERYYDLYLASPQEIAAFAHEAALSIIKDYGFTHATSMEELQGITGDDLVSAVDGVTSKRFAKPKNKKEIMVRKRYMKLAYLEVYRYLAHRRQEVAKQLEKDQQDQQEY